MTQWIRRSGAVTLTAGALLTAMAGTPASAHAGDQPAIRPAAITGADQERITRYWTPERMRQAVPMERLVTPRSVATAEVPTGTPTTVAPSSPQVTEGTALSLPNGGSPWTGGGSVIRTAGRVFFTFNGQNASCSGNAVTSANKSVVVTAGHCVKLQGNWHTNWAFVPGFDNGNRPFGTWTARATLATPQWAATEDINFDMGAAVVNQLNGRLLTDVVGAQGIAFNQPRRQPMYSFGYPAAAPYDGSKLIYCSGTTIDDFLLSRDLGLLCNMTGGSSGGPWFLRFSETTGTGLLNSVNSFKYNFLPWMFGPYFGADAQQVYNDAQSR